MDRGLVWYTGYMSNIKYISDPIQSRMAHDIRIAKWHKGLPPLLSDTGEGYVYRAHRELQDAIARDISLDMQELYRQLCWALGLPIVGDVTLSKGESLDAPIGTLPNGRETSMGKSISIGGQDCHGTTLDNIPCVVPRNDDTIDAPITREGWLLKAYNPNEPRDEKGRWTNKAP